MPTFEIDGRAIRYSLTGQGPLVLLTPGGRLGMDALSSLATTLEPHMQLLQWDRCNAGASDIWVDEPSEQLQWADDLALLLAHLDLGPAYLSGGSAGARVALLGAIRHPEIVRGLILWSVSGGAYSSQLLGYQYHVPYIQAATAGGMEAVVQTPYYQELIAANPGNRDRLLAIDPDRYIAIMHRWNEDFFIYDDTPVIGATFDQLRAVNAPTLVFEGNDDYHPAEAAEAVHQLVVGSELVACPWTRNDWMWRSVGRVPESVVELYPRMTSTIVDFIAKTEAALG